eukprot:7082835-Pyramimonas_sp.AAC.1
MHLRVDHGVRVDVACAVRELKRGACLLTRALVGGHRRNHRRARVAAQRVLQGGPQQVQTCFTGMCRKLLSTYRVKKSAHSFTCNPYETNRKNNLLSGTRQRGLTRNACEEMRNCSKRFGEKHRTLAIPEVYRGYREYRTGPSFIWMQTHDSTTNPPAILGHISWARLQQVGELGVAVRDVRAGDPRAEGGDDGGEGGERLVDGVHLADAFILHHRRVAPPLRPRQ